MFHRVIACAGAIAAASLFCVPHSVLAGDNNFANRFFYSGSGQSENSFIDALAYRPPTLPPSASAYADTSANNAAATALALGNQAIRKYLLPSLGAAAPAWAKRFEFEYNLQEDYKPSYTLLTVQPLYQDANKQNTVFLQASQLRYELLDKYRDTTNVGLGYRHLFFDNSVLAGVNAFYDHEWTYNHARVSLGGELKFAMLDFNGNWYKGVSSDRTVDASTSTLERVLDGYDLELRSQVPFLPWLQIGARRYVWQSDVADDIKGWSYSARADITQNLTVEAGWSDDNYDSNQGFVKFVLRLARTDRPVMLSNQIVSDAAFEKRDMRTYTLDKVRRENRIMVERTGGGIVIARGN